MVVVVHHTQVSNKPVNAAIATANDTSNTHDASPIAGSDSGGSLGSSSAVEANIDSVANSNKIGEPKAIPSASTTTTNASVTCNKDSSPPHTTSSVANAAVSTTSASVCTIASNETIRDLMSPDVRVIKAERATEPVASPIHPHPVAHGAIAAPSRVSGVAVATASTNTYIGTHKSDKVVQTVEFPDVHLASNSMPLDTTNIAGNRTSISGNSGTPLKADSATPKLTPSWLSYLEKLSSHKIFADNVKQDNTTTSSTPSAGIINSNITPNNITH